MKRCDNCGKQYSDDVRFCQQCGKELRMVQVNMGNQSGKQGNGNNTVLIAIIIALAAILITAGIILTVIFLNRSDSRKTGTETSETAVVNEGKETQAPQAEETQAPQSEETKAPETQDASAEMDTYRTYLDSLDTNFNNYIMSDKIVGEYTTYRTGLQDAITANSADNCKYNYDKLVALEQSLRSSSASRINTLKIKIKKLEKKSYARAAKKKSGYKENKRLAETAVLKGDFVTAKAHYDTCVDKLKEAKASAKKKKKKKSGRASAGSDVWYQTGAADNTTYQTVYLSRLSTYDVAGFSKEMKRYYMNTLFAAYGYRFQNATIQAFFNRQSWYTPDYSIAPGNQEAIKRKFDSMCMDNYHLLGGN